MAYDIPLPKAEYSDHFHSLTFGPIAAATTNTANSYNILFCPDKEIVIDSVTEQHGTSGSGGTLQLVYIPNGSTVSGALNTTNSPAITSALLINTANNTAQEFSMTDSTNLNNVVPANARVCVFVNANAASLANTLITVRYRERRR